MGYGEGSGEGWGEGAAFFCRASQPAEWKHGLFGCRRNTLTGDIYCKWKIGNCLCGWCCFPCLLCQNANKLEDITYIPMIYYLLGCIAPCIPVFLMRQKIRELNGIEGDTMGDVIAACCCTCCANIQIANEIDHH